MAAKTKRSYRVPRRIWVVLLILVALFVAGTFMARHLYNRGLEPVNASPRTQIFVVEEGSSVKQIAAKLQDSHLIRSAWAFQLYIHSKNDGDKLQAGTYALSPNEDVQHIVSIMTKGRVSTQLITVVPGRRIDQVKADFINDGFKPSEVDNAFTNLAQYNDLPVMAFKPASVNTLEGLLWPDSWFKDASTPPSYIVRQSLTAMGEHLTPDVQAAFAAQGHKVYDGLILASIVNQEVDKPNDQTQVAQVFLTRLKSGTNLESDATARYGAAVSDKVISNPNKFDSPYNTYLHPGLPPTPISTITASALNAAAHPAPTAWQYFVAGDDGNTYFSTNLKDHQALTQKYCHKLCGQ